MLPSCCACGHIDVFHAIRGNGSRGACGISAGAKAVPCGCLAFTAAEWVESVTGRRGVFVPWKQRQGAAPVQEALDV